MRLERARVVYARARKTKLAGIPRDGVDMHIGRQITNRCRWKPLQAAGRIRAGPCAQNGHAIRTVDFGGRPRIIH